MSEGEVVDAAAKKAARVRKRQACVYELVTTEKQYVDALRTAINTYIAPLRDKVPPADLAQTFGNMEMIEGFHKALLDSLEKQKDLDPKDQTIGAIFMKLVCFLFC